MLLTDHLVPVRVWVAAALGSGGTLTSAAIPNSRFKRMDGFMLTLTPASGSADVKIEYQVSVDGTNWNALATLIASTLASYASTPNGANLVPMPAPLAPFIRFKLTELASKATTVTATLEARE